MRTAIFPSVNFSALCSLGADLCGRPFRLCLPCSAISLLWGPKHGSAPTLVPGIFTEGNFFQNILELSSCTSVEAIKKRDRHVEYSEDVQWFILPVTRDFQCVCEGHIKGSRRVRRLEPFSFSDIIRHPSPSLSRSPL